MLYCAFKLTMPKCLRANCIVLFLLTKFLVLLISKQYYYTRFVTTRSDNFQNAMLLFINTIAPTVIILSFYFTDHIFYCWIIVNIHWTCIPNTIDLTYVLFLLRGLRPVYFIFCFSLHADLQP